MYILRGPDSDPFQMTTLMYNKLAPHNGDYHLFFSVPILFMLIGLYLNTNYVINSPVLWLIIICLIIYFNGLFLKLNSNDKY